MALKATVCKATLQIADIDRAIYADHQLTLARHPSENDERMMIRLLAFALNVPADSRDGALEVAKACGSLKSRALGSLTGRIRRLDRGRPAELGW